jgi:ribonuclease E
MLIDATHPEETRVAVVDGTRLEEFDFEMAARRQIKSNIYLAKVTRVEPSLQAAFVEYGGNRHGFLPFPEIHPDYYRIPVSDRAQRNSEPEERWVDTPYVASETSREDAAENAEWASTDHPGFDRISDRATPDVHDSEAFDTGSFDTGAVDFVGDAGTSGESADAGAFSPDDGEAEPVHRPADAPLAPPDPAIFESAGEIDDPGHQDAEPPEFGPDAEEDAPDGHYAAPDSGGVYGHRQSDADDAFAPATQSEPSDTIYVGEGTEAGEAADHAETAPSAGTIEQPEAIDPAEAIDVVGGDEVEDAQRRRRSQMPHYKIQEVIKRRQIMLVQVSKEERGNKGAAVTTFLSLPGRYCVLMPNTSRGGGVSRKIANPADRKRMKELISDLEVPDGMSVILRTAGVERSKAEIKRDLEYLLRLWENIRTLTLESTAPALIYEEGNLVKRAIRDLYTKDIESIEIAGEEGYRQAKDFMRMLMPSHAKRVQPYRDPSIPLFFRYQVESQIDLIHNPVAHLKSGGYIVINQTEALVSIDVNSGRSTRERNIEETALKTNLEAADEIGRQLRLRDMGGLIVIDFIDMDEPRHDAQVERRLKEAMKNDRARIQVGRISPFGLLELSRQRLHPSLVETHFQTCAHCLGTGLVRSIESASLLVLRAIEEEGIKRRSAELAVTVAGNIALYILNQKRGMLIDIEQRYGFSVRISADDSLIAPEHRIERVRLKPPGSELPPLSQTQIMAAEPDDEDEDESEEAEDSQARAAGGEDANAAGVDGDRKRKRRRNRRRRGRDGQPDEGESEEHQAEAQGERPDEQPFDGEEKLSSLDDPDTSEGDIVGAASIAPAAEPTPGLELGAAHDGETPAEGARRRRRGRRGGRSRARREDGRVGALPGSEDFHGEEFLSEEPPAGYLMAEDMMGDDVVGYEETAGEIDPAASVEGPILEDEAAEQPAPAEKPAPAEPEAEPASPAPHAAQVQPEISEDLPAAAERTALETDQPASEPPTPIRPAREYEIVNQPPAQPRRGFWKRLVE